MFFTAVVFVRIHRREIKCHGLVLLNNNHPISSCVYDVLKLSPYLRLPRGLFVAFLHLDPGVGVWLEGVFNGVHGGLLAGGAGLG